LTVHDKYVGLDDHTDQTARWHIQPLPSRAPKRGMFLHGFDG
jgi:hypothetical protein